MNDKINFLFEKSSKIGIVQFILALFIVLFSNLFELELPDKLQILLLGSSLFLAFAMVSHDQTKIFGFHFRLIGLSSSILGLILIYSPILLFYYDMVNFNLWLGLIIIGTIILSISVISDYYLIGIPEIVKAINYLFNFLKKVPDLLTLITKNIYVLIPIILIILLLNDGISKEIVFLIFLSSIIFVSGILNILLKNKSDIETVIRQTSNQAFYSISALKWKFEKKTGSYNCKSCEKTIKVTDTVCKACNTEISSCLICKLPFKDEKNTKSCENCEYKFHKNHWDFWMTFQNSCPNCKTTYYSPN